MPFLKHITFINNGKINTIEYLYLIYSGYLWVPGHRQRCIYNLNRRGYHDINEKKVPDAIREKLGRPKLELESKRKSRNKLQKDEQGVVQNASI